jgi:hypothetical protein
MGRDAHPQVRRRRRFRRVRRVMLRWQGRIPEWRSTSCAHALPRSYQPVNKTARHYRWSVLNNRSSSPKRHTSRTWPHCGNGAAIRRSCSAQHRRRGHRYPLVGGQARRLPGLAVTPQHMAEADRNQGLPGRQERQSGKKTVWITIYVQCRIDGSQLRSVSVNTRREICVWSFSMP